jgi:hypothetical protein
MESSEDSQVWMFSRSRSLCKFSWFYCFVLILIQVFDLIRNFFKSRGLSLAEEALRVELKAPASTRHRLDFVTNLRFI